tara:strand:+ start:152 stop:352 length:201 start_codon:yes stop_codon:yes gene_type:complete
MTSTKQLFEDLEQDALSIIGCSTSLLDAIKARDKIIYDLKAANKTLLYEVKESRLKLETINHPLKK